ncbi:MAG: extracellular solute-binding protein [Candidatus Caldarchaeum sp.]|nr:extracellular solute-binding protein [Candidatus Caldarchaeum sp.]
MRRKAVSTSLAVAVVVSLVIGLLVGGIALGPVLGGGAARTVTVERTLGVQTVTRTATAEVIANLEELARRETKLVIYGVMDTPDFLEKVVPEFKKAYPWAQVEYIGLSPAEITSRAEAEYRAGNVRADIVINTLGVLLPLKRAGALEAYANPQEVLMGYPAGFRDKDNQWHPAYTVPMVVLYNKNRVTNPADLPKKWTDLADPKWKDKIAMDRPSILNVAGALFATLKTTMSESDWNNFLTGLARNNPRMTSSASEAYTLVAAGEVHIAIGLLNDYLGQPAGAPVGVVWLDPMPGLPIAIAVTKRAPNPNMAKLFLEWWTSWSGQESVSKTNRVPAHGGVAAATILQGLIPPGINIVAAGSEEYYSNPDSFATRYRQIFGS